MSEISPITGSRKVSKKGFIIYEIVVTHARLGLKEIFRSEYPLVLERKANARAAQWDALWEKHQRKKARRTPSSKTVQEGVRTQDGGRLNLETSL